MLKIQSKLLKFRELRFSGDGKYLLIGHGDTPNDEEGYEVWNIPPLAQPVHQASETILRSAEWDPLSSVLYVPHDNGVNIVAPTGELLGALPAKSTPETGLTSLEFAPAGDWLLQHTPWQLLAAKRTRGKWRTAWSTKKSDRSSERFDSAALCADQNKVVVLYSRQWLDPHITFTYRLVLQDLKSGKVLDERPLSETEVPLGIRNRLVMLPDGSATIGYRGRSIYSWPTEPTSPAQKATVSRKEIWEAALHPSGRWLLIVSDAPEVVVWDTAAWKAVRSYDWGIGRLRCAACSPNGCLAAVGSDTNKVFIWDWEF